MNQNSSFQSAEKWKNITKLFAKYQNGMMIVWKYRKFIKISENLSADRWVSLNSDGAPAPLCPPGSPILCNLVILVKGETAMKKAMKPESSDVKKKVKGTQFFKKISQQTAFVGFSWISCFLGKFGEISRTSERKDQVRFPVQTVSLFFGGWQITPQSDSQYS